MNKITFFIFLTLTTQSAQAQFFKKLSKTAERAAERVLERKVERKATQETERVLDSTFFQESKTESRRTMPGLSSIPPAENYNFNHHAEMELTSGKDLMNIDYYLPETGNFLALLIKDKKIKDEFITVYDVDRETMYSFMENDGVKQKMGVAFQTTGDSENSSSETDIQITATGNSKIILGYNCQEYKMTGKDLTGTVWVTTEVSLRFPSTFYKVKQNKNNTQAWMKDIDGWAMEMTMVDSSRRKPQTIILKCLSISESNLEINTKAYLSLGF